MRASSRADFAGRPGSRPEFAFAHASTSDSRTIRAGTSPYPPEDNRRVGTEPDLQAARKAVTFTPKAVAATFSPTHSSDFGMLFIASPVHSASRRGACAWPR